jgi:O-antigen biosynthesis protein
LIKEIREPNSMILIVGKVWSRLKQSLGLAAIADSQRPNLLSRGKRLWVIIREQGTRFALAKVFKKISQKLDPTVPLPITIITTERLQEIPCSDDENYQIWLNQNHPRKADFHKMAETVEIFSHKPLISIITPVFNTPELFLRQAIESVINQVYPYWELCIADDASTKPHVKRIIEEYATKDKRIKVVSRKENGHISRASNSAIEIATGEFLALLDHDDLLTPDALYEVALLLNRHPDADMIYSDEDKIDEQNKLKEPFFKPDWCPDSFLSRMYTCHLGVYRKTLVDQIGGFREGYEGSQDYDLVLRLSEKTDNIFHLPKILYHWRVHFESAASNPDAKSYATSAAQKALADALLRRGETGRVTPAANLTGHHIIRYEISDYKLVSIIIPTRDLAEILDKCLTSIFEKTVYPNYEVVLIDNGSKEQETTDVIAKWQEKESSRFKCYPLDIPFNYSKINNYAVSTASGEYLLFLNNDIEVISPDWVNAMVEQAQRASIGAVGALLLYPDNTIQHAGVVMGIGGVAGHSHKHYPADVPGYFNQLGTVNNYSAVTAACLMCRREVFEAVGGFEEELKIAFNDVDFCLKIIEKGYRNIYLPHVVLYHYESKSRGYEDTPEKQARFGKEIDYMKKKWKKYIDYDPCYNLNLTSQHEDYSIKR